MRGAESWRRKIPSFIKLFLKLIWKKYFFKWFQATLFFCTPQEGFRTGFNFTLALTKKSTFRLKKISTKLVHIGEMFYVKPVWRTRRRSRSLTLPTKKAWMLGAITPEPPIASESKVMRKVRGNLPRITKEAMLTRAKMRARSLATSPWFMLLNVTGWYKFVYMKV